MVDGKIQSAQAAHCPGDPSGEIQWAEPMARAGDSPQVDAYFPGVEDPLGEWGAVPCLAQLSAAAGVRVREGGPGGAAREGFVHMVFRKAAAQVHSTQPLGQTRQNQHRGLWWAVATSGLASRKGSPTPC